MTSESMLVIEDEEVLGQELVRHFRRSGWEVERASTLADAMRLLQGGAYVPLVVLSDMSLPDGNALDLLERVRERPETGEWIFLTGYGSVPDSVRALRLGAYDFLEKPCPIGRLDLVVTGAARSARAQRRILDQAKQRNQRYSPEAFLGRSPASRAVRSLLQRLAQVPLSALVIEGETGTGKGLVARILHYSGLRSVGPMIELNCAALPAELLESELFGHEAGAFTGARGRHRGLFEQAHGGSLFLDEIGEMSLGLQAKLLKAVEDGRIRRLGAEKEIEIDAQVFAASNRDLETLVREGRFRQDLFHRLGVFRVELPPLRNRKEDLEDLVIAAVAEFNARSARHVTTIPERVWDRLRRYDWPGNVRELRNVIERSVLLAESEVFPEQWLQLPDAGGAVEDQSADSVQVPIDGRLTLDEMEALLLRTALERNRYNVAATARELGATRQTLRYRVEKHGIAIPGRDDSASGDG